jgi:predicted nucleic acid-binding protein
VPVIIPASKSPELIASLRSDPEAAAWWASPVECRSAFHRRHREGQLPAPLLQQALDRLADLFDSVDVVAPTAGVRERAGRVLAIHPLRAADALQLAAALVWCEGAAAAEAFVSLDERLRDAARREGFRIVPA